MRPVYVVIGDVHGYLDPLLDLISSSVCTAESRSMVVSGFVFLGDLVDRGPRDHGVLELVRQMCETGGTRMVLGNHDEYALRCYAQTAKERGRALPPLRPDILRPMPCSPFTVDLTPAQAHWLAGLPTLIRQGPMSFVHGGIDASLPTTPERTMRRIRRLPDGTPWMLSPDLHPNQHGRFVYYGHTVHSMDAPRIDITRGVTCVGLDTGLAFGGRLTAALVDVSTGAPVQFVQVSQQPERKAA